MLLKCGLGAIATIDRNLGSLSDRSSPSSSERNQHNNGDSLGPSSNLELSLGFYSRDFGNNSGSDAAQSQYWYLADQARICFKEDELIELNHKDKASHRQGLSNTHTSA